MIEINHCLEHKGALLTNSICKDYGHKKLHNCHFILRGQRYAITIQKETGGNLSLIAAHLVALALSWNKRINDLLAD